jgi:2-desacetyl-2-hydroxyethyl bacteriochlorophyllide A dehydrogenase
VKWFLACASRRDREAVKRPGANIIRYGIIGIGPLAGRTASAKGVEKVWEIGDRGQWARSLGRKATAEPEGDFMSIDSSTMNVAVYRGEGTVPVEEFPVPELAGSDVLVEVAFCGICGTDLHAIVEEAGIFGWGAPGFIGGHEWSGRVVALGDDVTSWRVGDRVTASSGECGTCPTCRAGQPSICRVRQPDDGQGAFSQYLRRREGSLVPLPDDLDLRAAALAEPFAVALHAVTRSNAEPGKRVLVTGAGPIGTLTVVALQVRGIENVTVSEPNPLRRALAERLGAKVVSPEELSEGTTHRFNTVIETSGNPRAVTAAFDCLVPGGDMVLVGVITLPTNLNVLRILTDEITVTGSALYDEGGIQEAVALLAAGRVPVDILTEPRDISLDDVADACAKLASGQLAGKVMVVPS